MYNQIVANKRKTWVLTAGVSALLLTLIVVLGKIIGVDPYTSLIFGAMFVIVYGLVAFYASGRVALSVNKARKIEKRDAPDLWNLVENLTIADGVPMPIISIMDDPSPNAFACGRDPEHAAICFTTGILALLSRRELEGVAAHELSHIKNYDTRVMTVIVVLVGAVALVSNILLHARLFDGRQRDNDNGMILFFVIGLVLAILSPFAAQLIQLAISRRREYLADASGALVTRFPEGLADALQKIAGASQPLRTANPATAHLFISDPFGARKEERSWFANLFSTHPPIEERIVALRTMTL